MTIPMPDPNRHDAFPASPGFIGGSPQKTAIATELTEALACLERGDAVAAKSHVNTALVALSSL